MSRKALLILPGGGAIGAFQCGAYRAISTQLRKRRIELVGIAGTSIGALNGALIARHHGERDGGADALESFWRDRLAVTPTPFFPFPGWYWDCWNGLLTTLLEGNPALSAPNYPAWNPLAAAFRADAALHVNGAMVRELTEHVGSYGPDPGRSPLLLVRAIDASTQQPVVFHSGREAVTARHIVASASIPLLYPLAEIDGASYWDGDLWPRTPLRDLLCALHSPPRQTVDEYLAIIVDTVCPERRRPTSALDLSFQIVASALQARAASDELLAEADNRYLDFLAECMRAADDREGSSLKGRIGEAYAAARAEGLCKLDIVRIGREALPFEYVSRDLDYSSARLDRLIEQGYLCANGFLDERL